MSIKHKEIEIPHDRPFANCKLNRQQYASILTNIINSYSDGFVLAINNKWGTGKTTFVRMWEQDLISKSYKTIYFNAWENDFEDNPLIALMGELKKITKEETEPKFKKVLKNAAILSKHIAPLVVQAIAEKYVDTKNFKEAIGKVTEGVANIFENEVDSYIEKKKGIIGFRKSLSEFLENYNEGRPLIFIVDELDRCRPNYAVSILEQIKHFFSVPNIVFILSIDKQQLGNAVRGVYGSEQIDSDEYLRRFIDVEYSIPEPSSNEFTEYLYDYFDFETFFNSENRQKSSELRQDKRDFKVISKILFSNNLITLRQQEKIFAHSRLVLRTFPDNFYVIPTLFMFLIFVKVIDENFYNEIKSKRITIEELQFKFFNLIKFKNERDSENELMWLEAYLILFYNNFINEDSYERNKIFERDDKGKKNLIVKSLIDKPNNHYFAGIFDDIERTRAASRLDINYFLRRIELIEEFVK
jgi:hypothetical protein